MRENEYRAWNIEEKIMCCDNEDGSKDYRDGVVSSIIKIINHQLQNDRYIFMQYTGIKDKNGKKIYEGDIVKCTQKGQSQLGGVIFTEGGFFREFEKGRKSFLNECVKRWEGEIVGNIYKNPELLN